MSTTSLSMTSDAPSFHRRVEEHTRCLCHDIKRLFYHHQRPHDLSSSTTPTKHANDKRKLIADTERWVICLEEQYQCRSGCNVIIIDALVSLLRTLDDVDVDNLQFLVNRYKGCSSRGKRVNDRKNQEPYDPSSASNKRQRRRLPPNIRSFEVVQALHDAEATIDSIDDDNNEQDVPTLYLSNSDRNKRAKKNTQLERHRGCSMMGISMKSILNVQTMPDDDGYGSQMPISTLTLDAAVLRRDLYKIIAACDIAEKIKPIVEGEGSSSKTEKLQMEMKHLVTTLLNRITEHPNSPSLRLSAMVALDSIRELELSDWGYKCMLDELLAVGESWSIRFYAEIVSECHTYENPSRLLLGISTLMKQALKTHGKCLSTLLGAVSQILVRRQHLLSVLDQVEHYSSLLRSEKGIYNRLCHSMSIQFGSISDWVLPTMSSDDKESVISALRAVGIISFFCSEDGEDEIRHGAPQSSQRVEEHPFELPVCRSLRSAHDRLGPCDGFNLLISHPESYELRIISPLYSRKPPIPSLVEEEEEIVGPFSSASDDILTNVFTFLGFRSLARASQCCTSWSLAITAAPALWSKLYFKRYKKSRFEEELAVKTEVSVANTYLRKFLSISSVADRQQVVAELVDDYDWKYLFAKKYGAEKHCKGVTCCVIGCHYVHRRSDHVKSHMRRHGDSILALVKKRNRFIELKSKTEQLKRQISSLEKNLRIITPEPTISSISTKLELTNTTSVLELVFANLDYKDITKPVCKLWTQLAGCNSLWKSLYRYHFGTALSLVPHTNLHWKIRFSNALLARNSIRGMKDNFGWSIRVCPVVDCNKALWSKFEFDAHLLKHVDQELTKRAIILRRDQKRNAKRKAL